MLSKPLVLEMTRTWSWPWMQVRVQPELWKASLIIVPPMLQPLTSWPLESFAVYTVARAMHTMRAAGISLDDGQALRNAIAGSSFQGISGTIAFDSQLDPILSGLES